MYQFVEGSDTTSYVAFYNFGEVGQNDDDRIVSGFTYEGVVVPQIQCLSSHQAVAVRDDGFTLYKGRQIPKESQTIKVDKEIVSMMMKPLALCLKMIVRISCIQWKCTLLLEK